MHFTVRRRNKDNFTYDEEDKQQEEGTSSKTRPMKRWMFMPENALMRVTCAIGSL